MGIIEQFPKKRVELPPAYQKIYEEHYLQNREGLYKTTSLSQRLESWMHRKVCRDVKNGTDKATLEIGAGTLNHIPYEKHISTYDIVEPFKELFENSARLQHISNQYSDISEVPNDCFYDRIISIAVFEHLQELPQLLALAATHLNRGGVIRVAIPNEGTLLWKLGTMVTGWEFKKKYGLDYQVLMQYEHVNSAKEIEQVLNYFFNEVKARSFGLGRYFSFYRFFECRDIKTNRVNSHLSTFGTD
jgi:hypothetical protein